MSDWIFIPAALFLMAGLLVGVVVWRRWVQTFRDPTFDEQMEQLSVEWKAVQEELFDALGVSALVDRLVSILARLSDE